MQRREVLKSLAFTIALPGFRIPFLKSSNAFRVAYVLFDGITVLDFVGIYDPLSRIRSQKHHPNFSWDICGPASSIQDSFGLKISIDKVFPDLSQYDMLILPGGFGTRALQTDETFISWLKTASPAASMVSVCTGSLLLGATGFLEGKMATTNFKEYPTLEKYCSRVSKTRIVEDGRVITAGAVASSLDLGLYLCEKLVGSEKTEQIRQSMDYHPSPFSIKKADSQD